MRVLTILAAGFLAGSTSLHAATPDGAVSAPIDRIHYDVTFNRETAVGRSLTVEMSFRVTGSGDVLLSLPAWTPGAYEISNFARWVSDFTPRAGSKELAWDKLDYDTWRIHPGAAREISVSFAYQADTLDNAMAWTRPDFAFFNGTNVFLYPEGRSLDFRATVTVHTEADWRVVTGMISTGEQNSYAETNYHDLVDKPFLVGRFDLDSQQVAGAWTRLATYPAGLLGGTARDSLWQDIARMIPPESAVFGETPWPHYTVMMVFDSSSGGGSALEHQNSHLGIYTPGGIGQWWVSSVTAHEIFHAWNVKRLRPSEMWPYRYDVPMPTPWLWVSEGITDYYADLALVRGGIIDSTQFLAITNGKISQVNNSAPVALEDASLSTWIHPTDGTGYLYYPKGSLAGLMLDIMIRDASNNARSLDDVMRSLYQSDYKKGKGFTWPEWWGAVSRAAGGGQFTEFNQRYVDGRDEYPWASLLPKAGLRFMTDTLRLPRVGISTNLDSIGAHVMQVVPGGAAAEAGIQEGDVIMELGGIPLRGGAGDPFEPFRQKFADQEGQPLAFKVLRGGQEVELTGTVHLVTQTRTRIEPDPGASPKAERIRHGIFSGRN